MLQQTQVATVIPYFDRFIERYPTVRALADAPRDDVLALWSGLGYYSRARNLHEAARQIVERFDGRVPDSVDDLMSLPGIGRYTAGAIASVAYDRRAPILDGNVMRVLARLFAIQDDTTDPKTRACLWELAEAVLPRERCGDFNQALMELGATICTPGSPQCLLCPLLRVCKAQAEGLTDCIPPPRQRTAVKEIQMVVAAVAFNGELLFVQRPQKGLWGGLWELPTEPLEPGEKKRAARDRLLEQLPVICEVESKPLPPVTRTLTHRRITFHIYRASRSRQPDVTSNALVEPSGDRADPASGTYRWLSPQHISSIGLSRACQAILEQLHFLV
jgi:A/G-specific adenine glycosylase